MREREKFCSREILQLVFPLVEHKSMSFGIHWFSRFSIDVDLVLLFSDEFAYCH